MPAGISPRASPWDAVAPLTKATPQPATCHMAAQPLPPWFSVCLSMHPIELPLTPFLFLFFSLVPSLCSSSGLFWGISLCWELAWALPQHPPSSPRTLPLSLCTLTPAHNMPEQPWWKDGLASACLSFSVHIKPPWKCRLGRAGVTCSGTGTDLAVLCAISGKAALGRPGSAPSPHTPLPQCYSCHAGTCPVVACSVASIPCRVPAGLACDVCALPAPSSVTGTTSPALPEASLPSPAGAGSSWSVF